MAPSFRHDAGLALFQRKTELNNRIEQARREWSSLEEQCIDLEEEMTRMQEETLELQESVTNAKKDKELYETKLKPVQESLVSLRAASAEWMAQKKEWRDRKAAAQRVFEESQLQFLQESKDFRAQCQQLQWEAKSLGLVHAHESAFAIAMKDVSPNAALIAQWDEMDDNRVQLQRYQKHQQQHQQQQQSNDNSANTNDNNHATDTGSSSLLGNVDSWEIPEDDHELQAKLAEYKQQKQETETLEKQASIARRAMEVSQGELSSAQERQHEIQSQLDRILQDTAKMKGQMRDKQRGTEEARGLAATFAQQTRQQQQQPLVEQQQQQNAPKPAAPARPLVNPYNKKTPPPRPTQASAAVSQEELRRIVLGDNTASMSTVRKNRRRNKFGSTLRISGGTMDNDDGSSSSDDENENNEFLSSAVPPCSGVASAGASTSAGVSLSSLSPATTSRASSMSAEQDALLKSLMEEDDHDDDLLSAPVFTKKTK